MQESWRKRCAEAIPVRGRKLSLVNLLLLAVSLAVVVFLLFPLTADGYFMGTVEGRSEKSAASRDNTLIKVEDSLTEEADFSKTAAAPKVIFIFLDKITLEDLQNHAGPVLSQIMEKSALGLMNTNTAGAPSTDNGYLSIGSGSRMVGNWMVRKAFHRAEKVEGWPAETLYRRHTGSLGVPEGELLHLYPLNLQQLNKELPYPAMVGVLGEALKRDGLAAGVLGNADTDTEGRQAVTVAMDQEGMVAYGAVNTTLLRKEGGFPFGLRSDTSAYLEAFRSCHEKASLLVVEWGDTTRIDAYLGQLPHARRGELLRESLKELDRFLLGIDSYLSEETAVFFLTPSPPRADYSGGQRLTPFIYYQPGHNQAGLAVSATTRRAGIISNIDIAPTVLRHLQLEPPLFLFGAPLTIYPEENQLQKISQLSRDTALLYKQRPPLLKGYIFAQIIILSAGLAGILARFRPLKSFQFLFYALLYFPVAILLAPAFAFFPAASLYVNVSFLLLSTGLLTFIPFFLFRNSPLHFIYLGFLVFGLLSADLLNGALFNSRSYLGYDPIGGARFYGMGNEYMGMMLGSFILASGFLFNFLQKRILLFATLFTGAAVFILFCTASPFWGANLGGALSAGTALAATTAGFISLQRHFCGRKSFFEAGEENGKAGSTGTKSVLGLTLRLRLGLFVPLSFLALALIFLYLLNVPGAGTDETVSHLGKTWELVRSDGGSELWNVIIRKVDMNLKLVRYSLWSRVLLTILVIISVLYYYPVGLMRRIFAKRTGYKIALGGNIAGSAAAFFLNDSGVVMAATIMLYGALPLLPLALSEVFDS